MTIRTRKGFMVAAGLHALLGVLMFVAIIGCILMLSTALLNASSHVSEKGLKSLVHDIWEGSEQTPCEHDPCEEAHAVQ